MHRIDTIDAVATLPPPAALGTPGFYSDGDIETGRRGTVMSADALNAVQEEICGVVEGAGMALDKLDNGQLLAAIQLLVQSAVDDQRVGEVFWWPYDTVPEGRALRCYGQQVPRAGDTAKLFAKSGTKYGAGDGITTFHLPDPRKYFLRVYDDRIVGETIGRTQADQNKSHAHGATSGAAGGHNHGGLTNLAGGHNHGGQTDAAGGHDHTTDVPPMATNTDTQGAADGSGNVDVTQRVSQATSAAPDHQHGIPAEPDHQHGIPAVPDHNHSVTVDADGGDEARPMNMAWPLYIRY